MATKAYLYAATAVDGTTKQGIVQAVDNDDATAKVREKLGDGYSFYVSDIGHPIVPGEPMEG